MKIKPPVVDYRKLRWNNLNSEEFKHLKLLIFWPVFGLLFLYVERLSPVENYYAVECWLDNYIPFVEYFLIPYLFWFVFLVFIHIYTLLYDIDAYKKTMKFFMITYFSAMLIYFIFPTCQELRPLTFERDNVFTRFMAGFYQFDTNTNVCPSIHVMGSLAVMFGAWHSKGLEKPVWKIGFAVVAMLICASTVFLKQHSIIDVIAALPICGVAYWWCFWRKKKQSKV